MSDSESDEFSFEDDEAVRLSLPWEGDLNTSSPETSYVAMFLQRIIESGQMHLFSHDEEQFYRQRPPNIKKKPCLTKLKANSIYQSIMNASGYAFDESKLIDTKWSVIKMLSNRENGVGTRNGSLTQPERCKINNNYLPNRSETIMKLQAKVYCGTFSNNGNYFITGSQDHLLRVFDSSTTKYRRINEIEARDVSWCILDITFSPNDEYFAYSTWTTCLHLSKVNGDSSDLQCLSLEPDKPRFCIFSLAFSNCGKQIIGGSNNGYLYIYDRAVGATTLKVPVAFNERGTLDENNDVNCVGFADDTSNIIYTGLDDGIIRIWDRRCLDESRHEPVGVLVGHYDGVTYIDPKKDGRYLISNSKDQSIKLWDLRVFSKAGAEKSALKSRQSSRSIYNWDYRWDNVPTEFYNSTTTMSEDTSIMTYRGHRVKKSLIRAKFSPLNTTGQRFIYTGCATGRLVIYDVLTGSVVQTIDKHTDIVRDVAWHPSRPEILTSSWDYSVNMCTYKEAINKSSSRMKMRHQPYSSSVTPRRSRRIANQMANRYN